MSANKKCGKKTEKSIRLDDVHWKLIDKLMPFYGSSETEVVRAIIILWLHENISSNALRCLKELDAINLE